MSNYNLGILYLILRPDEYPTEECTETVSIDGNTPEPVKSSHPALFVFLLMVINVVCNHLITS